MRDRSCRTIGYLGTGRGRGWPAALAAASAGFVAAAGGVYAWLRRVWPTQHDLSDIGTGLMRLFVAFLAGLVAAAAVAIVTRWLRARRARDHTDFPT